MATTRLAPGANARRKGHVPTTEPRTPSDAHRITNAATHHAATNSAASTGDSPLPSFPFGTTIENEKDSADRRAGWKGIEYE